MLQIFYRITTNQIEMDNTANGYGVFFLPERCEDRCGAARDKCAEGIMMLEGPGVYLYESEIKKTHDGESWAQTPTDPFAYGGEARAGIILETVDGMRYVVFRSEAVVGHPAEASYSDDQGVTWTSVEVGAINGQQIFAVALYGAYMYITCSDGYIYRSGDEGASWELMTGGAGAPTAQDLNAIDVYEDDSMLYAVGDTNAFIYSNDGGESWYAGTGPAVGVDLLSVAVNDQGHLFVGTNDGRLFRSDDEGDTWTTEVDHGVGTIPWIEFDPEAKYTGCYVWNNATPEGAAYRSLDGGASWQIIRNMPDNLGINSGHMCDLNTIFFVGNILVGGTTFAAVTSPATS
jgi:photosystem II stability/assembly factor-like uncharacterized protein